VNGQEAPAAAPKPMLHALMVINRRGTRSHADLEASLARLEEAGIEASAHFCREPGRIPALIERHGGDADMIIVGGGDGTISHSAAALLEADRPVGLLPMGNANDLARTLAIPTDLVDACGIIAAGNTRRVDLGTVNGRPFFNVVSLGVSVRIARRLNPETKRRWGVLAYLGSAWEALRAPAAFTARITCDGETTEIACMQITVGNGRHYGAGMTIVEDAAIDDGRLDLIALPPVRRWRWLVLLPMLRWGRHRGAEEVTALNGQTIRIETERPMAVNVDGEVLAETPVDFSVMPAALEMFVPLSAAREAPGLSASKRN
jgi:YegS/Rv2252/BmrU family lipid kinase